MPYARPLLDDLLTRALADLESEMQGADVRLRFSVERALAKACSGLSHSLHGHLDHATRQLFPTRCDDEFLDFWGWVFDTPRLEPQAASGDVFFGGTGTIGGGVVMLIGARLYTTTESVDFVGPDKAIDVLAQLSGIEGNAESPTVISLQVPIAGINDDGVVSTEGISGGTEREEVEAYRARVLDAIRAAGSGGGPGDYKVFAKAADSRVTRVFELPLQLGAMTVQVLIANDNENPPIASGELVTIVQDFVQKRELVGSIWKITGVAPVTAIVTITSVATKAFDVVAELELDDDAELVETVANVTAALDSLVQRVAAPEVTITLEEIIGTIQSASGVKTHDLVSPVADVTHLTTQIPIPGTYGITEI